VERPEKGREREWGKRARRHFLTYSLVNLLFSRSIFYAGGIDSS
jgi:hypothetical protein